MYQVCCINYDRGINGYHMKSNQIKKIVIFFTCSKNHGKLEICQELNISKLSPLECQINANRDNISVDVMSPQNLKSFLRANSLIYFVTKDVKPTFFLNSPTPHPNKITESLLAYMVKYRVRSLTIKIICRKSFWH